MKRPPKSRCLSVAHSAGTPSRTPTTLLILLSWIPTNHSGAAGSSRAGSLPSCRFLELRLVFRLAGPMGHGKCLSRRRLEQLPEREPLSTSQPCSGFVTGKSRVKHWLWNTSSQEQTRIEKSYMEELLKEIIKGNPKMKNNFQVRRVPRNGLLQFLFFPQKLPEKKNVNVPHTGLAQQSILWLQKLEKHRVIRAHLGASKCTSVTC